jgi:hypothetical protein
LQGESLRPLLEGDDATPTRDVFIEWNGHNNGFGDAIGSVSIPEPMRELGSPDEIAAAITDPVRTVVTADGWKLNLSPLGEHELYHLAEDPYETRNLAGQAEMQPKMVDLAERIRRWQARTGDTTETGITEAAWLGAATTTRAFDFLEDPAEDIYTREDGRPFHPSSE